MHSVKGTSELVENLVEDLYTQAPGPIIDHVRSQATKIFESKMRPGYVMMSIGGPHFLLQLAVDDTELAELADDKLLNEFVKEQEGVRPGYNIASMLHQAADEYSERLSDDVIEAEPARSNISTEFLFFCLVRLYKDHKDKKGEEFSLKRPGMVLYLSSLEFRLIGGGPKTMFSAIWRSL